jgi:hypothetical protein
MLCLDEAGDCEAADIGNQGGCLWKARMELIDSLAALHPIPSAEAQLERDTAHSLAAPGDRAK